MRTHKLIAFSPKELRLACCYVHRHSHVEPPIHQNGCIAYIVLLQCVGKNHLEPHVYGNKRCKMDPPTIWQQPKLITRTEREERKKKMYIYSAGMKKNTHTIDRKHVAPWIMASLHQPNSVVCNFASPNNLRTRWEFTGVCVCVLVHRKTVRRCNTSSSYTYINIYANCIYAGQLHFHTHGTILL